MAADAVVGRRGRIAGTTCRGQLFDAPREAAPSFGAPQRTLAAARRLPERPAIQAGRIARHAIPTCARSRERMEEALFDAAMKADPKE
jgi:hypothetical protein